MKECQSGKLRAAAAAIEPSVQILHGGGCASYSRSGINSAILLPSAAGGPSKHATAFATTSLDSPAAGADSDSYAETPAAAVGREGPLDRLRQCGPHPAFLPLS